MSKEQLIKKIMEEYPTNFEDSPKPDEIIRDVEELYDSKIGSEKYLELKNKIISSLSARIEQSEREKRGNEIVIKKILEELLSDLSEAELWMGIK
jgi:hypothetical protein